MRKKCNILLLTFLALQSSSGQLESSAMEYRPLCYFVSSASLSFFCWQFFFTLNYLLSLFFVAYFFSPCTMSFSLSAFMPPPFNLFCYYDNFPSSLRSPFFLSLCPQSMLRVFFFALVLFQHHSLCNLRTLPLVNSYKFNFSHLVLRCVRIRSGRVKFR